MGIQTGCFPREVSLGTHQPAFTLKKSGLAIIRSISVFTRHKTAEDLLVEHGQHVLLDASPPDKERAQLAGLSGAAAGYSDPERRLIFIKFLIDKKVPLGGWERQREHWITLAF